MLKVGDQVIVTKVDRDDKRHGLQADMVCKIVTANKDSAFLTIQPITSDRIHLVCKDQVRKF